MTHGNRVSTGLVIGIGAFLGATLGGAACLSSSSPNPATSDAGGTPTEDGAAPSTDAGDAATVDASDASPGTDAGPPVEAGLFTEFPIPTAGSSPNGITAGPDGNLWFTEFHTAKVARSRPPASSPSSRRLPLAPSPTPSRPAPTATSGSQRTS